MENGEARLEIGDDGLTASHLAAATSMALPDPRTDYWVRLRAHVSYAALSVNRNYGKELHMRYKEWQFVFAYRYAAAQRQAFVWRRRSRRSDTEQWYTETATVSGWKGVDEAAPEVHAAWMKADAARNRDLRQFRRSGGWRGGWRRG